MIRTKGLLALSISLSGCSASHADWSGLGRPAEGLAALFQPDSAFARVEATVAACLTLAESASGPSGSSPRGDYDVSPAKRCGVAPGERLRLDCATRRALGIVRH